MVSETLWVLRPPKPFFMEHVHGWTTALCVRGLEVKPTFEKCRKDFFFFARCIRQGSVEAPRFWFENGVELGVKFVTVKTTSSCVMHGSGAKLRCNFVVIFVVRMCRGWNPWVRVLSRCFGTGGPRVVGSSEWDQRSARSRLPMWWDTRVLGKLDTWNNGGKAWPSGAL